MTDLMVSPEAIDDAVEHDQQSFSYGKQRLLDSLAALRTAMNELETEVNNFTGDLE